MRMSMSSRLVAWFALRLKDSPLGFYGLFAVTVTASEKRPLVQLP